MRTCTRLLVNFAAVAGVAAGQAPQSPTLTVLFDSAQRALRPIFGSLGASYVGSALDSGMALAIAQVSPGGDYAVGAEQSTGQVVVLKSLTGKIASVKVNAPQRPDVIELSPMGQAAVLGYESDQMLLVITGLPDNPQVARSVSFQPAGFTAMDSIQRLAVSDDGQALAFSTRPKPRTGSTSRAFYVETGGTRRRPAEAQTVTAVTFLDGSHDLVVADRQTNSMLRGSADATGAPFTVVASGPTSGAPIVGLGVTPRDAHIYAAADSGEVLVWDPGQSELKSTATCACTPDGMFRMPGSATWRLNSLPAESVWVYQGGLGARLLFVPVATATVRLHGGAVSQSLEGAGQ